MRWHPSYSQDYDQLILSFSDVEMGAGGAMDDFPQSKFLMDLVLKYNEPPFSETPVHLVFNGDTFDLLKTSYLDTYPHHVTANIALSKMTRIIAAHPHFFDGLRKFLHHPGAERKVYFVVGNHDPEILFPEVQNLIRSFLNHHPNVFFPGFELDFGDVHIEHGSQHDGMFFMDPQKPFVEHENTKLLNVSWASVAIMQAILPLQQTLFHLDRVKPKKELLKILPEMRELLVATFWNYWTKNFFKDYLKSTDPFKKVSWTMLKEVSRRFVSQDPDLYFDKHFVNRIHTTKKYRLYLVGHLHEVFVGSNGNRKIIQTGCFRNEFMIGSSSDKLEPISKTYAEVFLKNNRLVRSELVEVNEFPMPERYIPCSLPEFRPIIKQIIGTFSDRSKSEKEIAEQEKRERQMEVQH